MRLVDELSGDIGVDLAAGLLANNVDERDHVDRHQPGTLERLHQAVAESAQFSRMEHLQ